MVSLPIIFTAFYSAHHWLSINRYKYDICTYKYIYIKYIKLSIEREVNIVSGVMDAVVSSRFKSRFLMKLLYYSLSQNGWDTLGSLCPLKVGVEDLVTEPR